MILFLALSGALGVTLALCAAQTCPYKALSLLSLIGLSQVSQGLCNCKLPLTYLQTEPKILRLVCSCVLIRLSGWP